ncbi:MULTISPECIES: hypothetical protein [Sphingobium]|uniref:Uncharacterized protein n=1 Tax=Sphingobium cupriresistens LL01 TaxID=1420583 RepID=A0A0J7XVU6_9SPHN|nr:MULTISPECIES: hypothetical protein [Sphingobium]KMS55841.1 hypothetical protein V473_14080 [Sphingobium cupriresistens LL01]WCP12832.1 hypothetical protein sphantq_01237 [Sphingobium sp. AntQ-1]
MRSTYDNATVRLYHLGDDGAARTIMYGPLSQALHVAEQQSVEVQDGLFLATDNDVVAYLDLIES